MLVVRRTAALIVEVWLACHVRFQCLHQARFADTGFAAEQYYLPHTRLRLHPVLPQQPEFDIPSHQGCETLGTSHVQPTSRPAHPEDAIDLERRGDTSECLDPEVMHGEIPLHEARGRTADHHGVRSSKTLEAGCNVWRLAQGELFLSAPFPYFSHHDQTRMHSYPGCQAHPLALRQSTIKGAHGLDNPQPHPHRPLRIVFVGLWIAKVD